MAEIIKKTHILDLDFEKYSIVQNPSLLAKVTDLLYELRDKFFNNKNEHWLDFGGDGISAIKTNGEELLITAFEVLDYIKKTNFEKLGFPAGYGRVRIALNYQEVSLRINNEGEIENVSAGIGPTARLQSVTEPNEIFVSKDFIEHTKNDDTLFTYLLLGEYKIGKGHDIKPIEVSVLIRKNDINAYHQRIASLKQNLQSKTEQVKDRILEIMLEEKEKYEEEIRKLFAGLRNAGIETKGGYENRINLQCEDLNKLENRIENHKKKS